MKLKLDDLNKLQLWALMPDDNARRSAMLDLGIKATGQKEVVGNRVVKDGVIEGNLYHVEKEQLIKYINYEFEKPKKGEEEPKKEEVKEEKPKVENKKIKDATKTKAKASKPAAKKAV